MNRKETFWDIFFSILFASLEIKIQLLKSYFTSIKQSLFCNTYLTNNKNYLIIIIVIKIM